MSMTIGTPPVSPRLLAQAEFLTRDIPFAEGPYGLDRAAKELEKRLATLPEGKAVVTFTKGEDYFLKTIDYTPGRSPDPQAANGLTPFSVSFRRNGEPVDLMMAADSRRPRD